jgi:hypothetical protein
MRKIQNLGAALTLAGVLALGMMTSTARVEAAGFGPNNPNTQTLLCSFAKSAIEAAATALGPDSALVIYLQQQYTAAGCE